MTGAGDAIREDIVCQVSDFVQLLQQTFDPSRYPRLTDGGEFDRSLERLASEFDRLQKLFQDYLMASWSAEIAGELGGANQDDVQPERHPQNGGETSPCRNA